VLTMNHTVLAATHSPHVCPHLASVFSVQGARGTNITVDTLCGIMSDASRGSEVERYAAVNELIMNVYEQKCLDFKYENMISQLSQTTWNTSASEGGT